MEHPAAEALHAVGQAERFGDGDEGRAEVPEGDAGHGEVSRVGERVSVLRDRFELGRSLMPEVRGAVGRGLGEGCEGRRERAGVLAHAVKAVGGEGVVEGEVGVEDRGQTRGRGVVGSGGLSVVLPTVPPRPVLHLVVLHLVAASMLHLIVSHRAVLARVGA